MQLNNDMDLTIHKSWYNRTEVQSDGITQIVQPKRYPMYILELQKIYQMESKAEVIDQIISDLQSTIAELEEMKQKEEVERWVDAVKNAMK